MALILAVALAEPQFFNRRPFGGGFGGNGGFGGRPVFGPGVVGLRPLGGGFLGIYS